MFKDIVDTSDTRSTNNIGSGFFIKCCKTLITCLTLKPSFFIPSLVTYNFKDEMKRFFPLDLIRVKNDILQTYLKLWSTNILCNINGVHS